jgi:hypothetical protein
MSRRRHYLPTITAAAGIEIETGMNMNLTTPRRFSEHNKEKKTSNQTKSMHKAIQDNVNLTTFTPNRLGRK